MLEVARTYAGLAAEHFEFPIEQWPDAPYLQLMSVGFFIDEDLLVYHAMVLRDEPSGWSEPVFFGNFTELPNEWFHEEMIRERFETDVETFKTQDFLRAHFDAPSAKSEETPVAKNEETPIDTSGDDETLDAADPNIQ